VEEVVVRVVAVARAEVLDVPAAGEVEQEEALQEVAPAVAKVELEAPAALAAGRVVLEVPAALVVAEEVPAAQPAPREAVAAAMGQFR
jgi:hypothetical protein